jgi:hypothetical protein
MRPIRIFLLAMISAAAALIGGTETVVAQATAEIPPILITPDKLESRIGTLEFKDGAPSAETVQKVYDTLDFTRGLDAFSTVTAAHPRMRSVRAFSASAQRTIRSPSTPN